MRRHGLEPAKKTIFEADQNIDLVGTFMVAADTVAVGATLQCTHRLLLKNVYNVEENESSPDVCCMVCVY